MEISFDEAKRQLTLEIRGLDFRDAARFFAAPYVEYEDDRFNYGERRFIALGHLDGRSVAIIWTPRGKTRRIISMRHAHAEEIEARKRALD
jgi:hypothetical protein